MLKQCAFSYSDKLKCKLLKIWPLSIKDDIQPLMSINDCPEVLCAIRSDLYDNGVVYPGSDTVPGKPVLNGLMKRFKKKALLLFFETLSRNLPQDLLLYCPQRLPKTDAEMALIKKACLGGSDNPHYSSSLKRFGGTWIYVHDGENVTIMTNTESEAKQTYCACMRNLTHGIDNGESRKCWNDLKTHKDHAQIVAGYSKTIYLRYAPESVLLFEKVFMMLSWDCHKSTIYRAGAFDPTSYDKKAKHPIPLIKDS